MDTERLLTVVAILRAYATCDAEGIEMLIKGAAAESYADLLAFALMLVQYHQGDPVAYLDQMANGLVVMAHEDAARLN